MTLHWFFCNLIKSYWFKKGLEKTEKNSVFKLDKDSVILLTNKNRYHIEALNVLRNLLTMINKQPNVQEKILGILWGFCRVWVLFF